MFALGDYRFSIPTAAYQDLERTNEWRWATVDRIGVTPAKQFMGPGEDAITMSGIIYPGMVASRQGLEQVPRMRAEAALGLPRLLVDGSGRVWGEYVITNLREGQKTFFSDGAPRAIEFSISLSAYGG
jgi:phage protein U